MIYKIKCTNFLVNCDLFTVVMCKVLLFHCFDFHLLSSILKCMLYFADGSPRTSSSTGDDWRSAFDAAANGPVDRSLSRSSSNGHSRHYSDPAQNGDVSGGSNSGSRRTPNRLPPPPPGSSGSRYF